MSKTIDKKLWKEICLKITGKDHVDETDKRYDFVEGAYKFETESPIERNRNLIAYLNKDLQKEEEYMKIFVKKIKNLLEKNN